MDRFLDEIKTAGFSGVQNFPTVGLIDGTFRANLEETGMSYALEVEMIALASKKDMLTTPYVFSAQDAAAMAQAGADIIVCHLGLTTGGAIGAETAMTLEQCPAIVDEWAAAALAVNPKVVILVPAGRWPCRRMPTLSSGTPNIVTAFMARLPWSVLPTEVALTEQTKKFKQIGRQG